VQYAAQDDLVTRVGEDEVLQIAPNAAGDAIDEDRVTAALSDASRHIDSYLRRRRTVPVDPVPDVLIGACCDIARFNLHDDHVPDAVKDRYEATRAWLKAIANGTATLGDDGDTSTSVGRVVHRSGRSQYDWEAYGA
jgi:phage gp36-like protein